MEEELNQQLGQDGGLDGGALEQWTRFYQSQTVRPEELPDQVFDRVRGGMTPLEAYQAYRLEESERRAAILENNSRNQQRAIGSLRTDGAGRERDAFLEGLFQK